MAIIKCKMCGGNLILEEGSSIAECEYCGTRQTVPAADSEKKLSLFARANRLRLANEFDKAAGVYESIVADFPEEAEAYWGLVLCKYGIEYVDDPATGKKIPTCHRSSFDSVLDDGDFDQACENADGAARKLYREEAKAIEELRRGILEVSGKEAPYDIFICYKETAEDGDRTIDSVIAQDVYDALTSRGYRVFFSRVSLEDKLGTEYEPYIFAALNSAKIMLAFGTDYEYYNAVWVKNEWSRFLKLMEKDKGKHLIPCYKNLDPYDMPKEFQRLQGQDMGKVGAVQDLLRGIEKIMPRKGEEKPVAAAQPVVQQVVQGGGPNVTALLQRGQMSLEDGEWEKAKDYYDQVLNMDAQSADAYLGLALADLRLHSAEAISSISEAKQIELLENNSHYKKFIRFSSEERKAIILGLLETAKEPIRVKQQKQKMVLVLGRAMMAPGMYYSMGVQSNGTVLTTGDCPLAGASGMQAVAAGLFHSVGLKMDGSVIASGDNSSGQCNIFHWENVTDIAVGRSHTVGLISDGTVLCAGSNGYGQCNTQNWRDIIAVAAGFSHTVGLRENGTVTAVGDNFKFKQCSTEDWRNIVAVAAGSTHTVGLKNDGTVLATGNLFNGQSNTSAWRGIIAISAGSAHTVGLTENGTVVAVGSNEHGQCDVSHWRDIIAIAAGGNITFGMHPDGTIVAAGANFCKQCDVGSWKLYDRMDMFMEEREKAKEAYLSNGSAEKSRSLRADWIKYNEELEQLTGVFAGKRKKSLEDYLAQIVEDLKRLK